MKSTIQKLMFLIVGLLVTVNAGAYDFEVDGIYYNITSESDRKVSVTYENEPGISSSYSGAVIILSKVLYNSIVYNVTSIGDGAFYDCTGLTSITIPNSVTEIGYEAFYDCDGLTNITIPNSVTSIASSAFYNCDGFTSITIPYSVTSIGNGAFGYCKGLTSIVVERGNTKYDSRDNCNAIIETATNTLIHGCKSTIIPNSVTSIGDDAFNDCAGLTSVTIPNSVTKIGNGAFGYCYGLTSVTIGNSVRSIGDDAFCDCRGLTSITIPNSVTKIGDGAFNDCTGLTSITIPYSVTSIGKEAFGYCKGLTSIVVERGNTKYDSRDNCNAIIETATNTLTHGCKSTIIPNSVTSIGDDAFNDCTGLTSVTIPNSVTSIGDGAFNDCTGLISVTIGNSVRSIGDGAFNDCRGLISITIGNSVSSIGDGAFNDCDGLTSIIIPNSVTSIGKLAFQGCTGLKSVYCKATTPPTAGYSMFDSETLSGTLYIPNGSIGAYKAVVPWGNFVNIIETGVFPDGGVEGIESDGINVAVKGVTIEVSGAEGERIEVYSLSGQCVYSGIETSIPVEKGIYIVRVAGTVHKVIL